MTGRNYRRYFKYVTVAVLVLFGAVGLGIASVKHVDGKAAGHPAPPPPVHIEESAEPVSVNATVMEIDPDGGYVIIAEKTFELAEYELDGQNFKIGPEKLKRLKKGMRVVATGFRLDDGRIIAESIEAAP